MSNELKDCPFCGSTAHVDYDRMGLATTGRVHCVAMDCRAEVWSHKSKDDAIAMWNRRAAPSVASSAPADERMAFEAWCKGRDTGVVRLKGTDQYLVPAVQAAWVAWQGRAAIAASQQAAQPKAAMTDELQFSQFANRESVEPFVYAPYGFSINEFGDSVPSGKDGNPIEIPVMMSVSDLAKRIRNGEKWTLAPEVKNEILSDSAIIGMASEFPGGGWHTCGDIVKFARKIEAASAPNKQLVAALTEMVSWFGLYPEFIPVPEACDNIKASIATARAALASIPPTQEAQK